MYCKCIDPDVLSCIKSEFQLRCRLYLFELPDPLLMKPFALSTSSGSSYLSSAPERGTLHPIRGCMNPISGRVLTHYPIYFTICDPKWLLPLNSNIRARQHRASQVPTAHLRGSVGASW